MQNTFAILGAGMQGTAAAYDLVKFANNPKILMADQSFDQAKAASDRVNKLTKSDNCTPYQVDALDSVALGEFLTEADIVISCVPYWMHTQIAKVAVDTITDMVDLGGNTDVTLQTLGLDPYAKENEVTLVPDTGLAPGLVNSVGLYMVEQLDVCETVNLYCGVLPQNPKPPFNYKVTFNVEGLVAEYDYKAVVLRAGNIAYVPTLTELETLHFDGLGEMEAFVTSGGTSTAPMTLEGKVRNYEYKTVRYPGHCQYMKVFKDFGLWREDEIEVNGSKVKPKDVFVKVFGPELAKYEDLDLCVVRGVGIGMRGNSPVRIQLDIFDKQDEETGFTSMERLTGFSTSIIAQEVVQGNVAKGAVRYEKAMSGTSFLRELRRRGIAVRIQDCEEVTLD